MHNQSLITLRQGEVAEEMNHFDSQPYQTSINFLATVYGYRLQSWFQLKLFSLLFSLLFSSPITLVNKVMRDQIILLKRQEFLLEIIIFSIRIVTFYVVVCRSHTSNPFEPTWNGILFFFDIKDTLFYQITTDLFTFHQEGQRNVVVTVFLLRYFWKNVDDLANFQSSIWRKGCQVLASYCFSNSCYNLLYIFICILILILIFFVSISICVCVCICNRTRKRGEPLIMRKTTRNKDYVYRRISLSGSWILILLSSQWHSII